jgi:hypothetical protein
MTTSGRISLFLISTLCASASFAQLARTAVSVSGNDLNSCAPASPCRSFAHAITQTASGGEMIALDSGGYGPFTIDRPISIQAAPGVYAGITASSGSAITVAPGPFTLGVMIRGLFVNGTGATTGIDISNAFDVFIDKCTVHNFGTGISITVLGIYNIKDTIVRGDGSGNGVVIGAASGSPSVSIDSSRITDNNIGLTINNNASVVMFSSVVAQNGSFNVVVNSANPAFLTITDSLIHGYNKNGDGVRVQQAGSTVTVTRSTIADCATGFDNVSGTFNSTRDNTIDNCTTASAGTILQQAFH